LTIAPSLILAATAISKSSGLLSSDALVVAAMQANSLVNLASSDQDFDRVPGITRFGPA
jgi:predicted nucleic acid-binding protein